MASADIRNKGQSGTDVDNRRLSSVLFDENVQDTAEADFERC
jgi:hypothetical protein